MADKRPPHDRRLAMPAANGRRILVVCWSCFEHLIVEVPEHSERSAKVLAGILARGHCGDCGQPVDEVALLGFEPSSEG